MNNRNVVTDLRNGGFPAISSPLHVIIAISAEIDWVYSSERDS
jgi:hypothetical protein